MPPGLTSEEGAGAEGHAAAIAPARYARSGAPSRVETRHRLPVDVEDPGVEVGVQSPEGEGHEGGLGQLDSPEGRLQWSQPAPRLVEEGVAALGRVTVVVVDRCLQDPIGKTQLPAQLPGVGPY